MALQKKSIAFFAFAILAFLGLASCTNSISTMDTNLSLDLSPLSARMSALRSQGAISTGTDGDKIETYYLHCTAVNTNDVTKVYVDEKKEMSFEYTDTQKSITIQLTNIPFGEEISVDMKIFWDSSYSDYSMLAQGSTSLKIASSSDVSLTLTSTEKLASTISYKYSNENLTTFDEKNVSGGSDIVFTASYSGGTTPTYTWYVNGTALTGKGYTSSTMTASLDTLISLAGASSNNVYNIRCDISENGIVRSADNTVSLTYYKQIKSVAFENASYTYLLPSSGTWYTDTASADGASTQTEYTPVWASPKYIVTYTDGTASDPTSAEIAAPAAVGQTTGSSTITDAGTSASFTPECTINTYGIDANAFAFTQASSATESTSTEKTEYSDGETASYTVTLPATTYIPAPTDTSVELSASSSNALDTVLFTQGSTGNSLSVTFDEASSISVGHTIIFTYSNIKIDGTSYTLATKAKTISVKAGTCSFTVATADGTTGISSISGTTSLTFTATYTNSKATFEWYANGTLLTLPTAAVADVVTSIASRAAETTTTDTSTFTCTFDDIAEQAAADENNKYTITCKALVNNEARATSAGTEFTYTADSTGSGTVTITNGQLVNTDKNEIRVRTVDNTTKAFTFPDNLTTSNTETYNICLGTYTTTTGATTTYTAYTLGTGETIAWYVNGNLTELTTVSPSTTVSGLITAAGNNINWTADGATIVIKAAISSGGTAKASYEGSVTVSNLQ